MPTENTAETITFNFTASRADGTGREIEFAITVEDDGSPMVDIEESAEDRAYEFACKKLGTSEVEVISQGAA